MTVADIREMYPHASFEFLGWEIANQRPWYYAEVGDYEYKEYQRDPEDGYEEGYVEEVVFIYPKKKEEDMMEKVYVIRQEGDIVGATTSEIVMGEMLTYRMQRAERMGEDLENLNFEVSVTTREAVDETLTVTDPDRGIYGKVTCIINNSAMVRSDEGEEIGVFTFNELRKMNSHDKTAYDIIDASHIADYLYMEEEA